MTGPGIGPWRTPRIIFIFLDAFKFLSILITNGTFVVANHRGPAAQQGNNSFVSNVKISHQPQGTASVCCNHCNHLSWIWGSFTFDGFLILTSLCNAANKWEESVLHKISISCELWWITRQMNYQISDVLVHWGLQMEKPFAFRITGVPDVEKAWTPWNTSWLRWPGLQIRSCWKQVKVPLKGSCCPLITAARVWGNWCPRAGRSGQLGANHRPEWAGEGLRF